MKKLILSALILLYGLTLKAQTVNGIPLKDIDVEYLQIVGTSRLLSTKLTIKIDFGRRTKFFSSKKAIIKCADGKSVNFDSMIDALNFMSKNGYEFVNAYVITDGHQNVYYYLLRNKKYKSDGK